MKAAIDAECRHGLEKLQMLLSHTDPHLTLGGLVARRDTEAVQRNAARAKGSAVERRSEVEQG